MLRLLQIFRLTLTAALVACASSVAFAAGGEGDHAASESSGGLLSFDLGSYVWKIIIFTLFMIVLAKFVWPPILNGLKAREAKLRNDFQTAEDASKEAQTTLAEYKQQLAEAQKEAQRIIDESRSQAQQVGAQLKAQAEADAVALRDRNAAEIQAAKEQAIAEVYSQTAEIATQVASKILAKEISAADQQTLVNQSLQELGELNRN